MTDLSKDRGFLLGDGVFDTLVAFNGKPVEGERHLARLVAQAVEIGITVGTAEVAHGWRNTLSEFGAAPCIFRTTISRGTSERGLWPEKVSAPTVAVAASPWSPALMQGPVSLVASVIRRNDQSPSSRLKSLSYLDNILAAREAQERGADDALLLNTAGNVACTTIANVFALKGARLATPPLTDGVLAGIMRALVLELAAGIGLTAEERSLLPADLAAADLLFVTNSVRFLRPVSALDATTYPTTLPEPFLALRSAVAARVADGTGYELRWD